MKLKIDSEFRDLIPPLSQDEVDGLESSIVENGYNPAFPIIVWKGQEIVVDGHNRYSICQKHGLPFETVEQEFASRYDVVAWIIKNQLARRNVNKLTRLYLIGRRYLVEKNEHGGDRKSDEHSKSMRQNDALIRTSKIIADQVNAGYRTVERAAEFTQAIDALVSNTGITCQFLLSGQVKATVKDIVELAQCGKDIQSRVISKVTDKSESDIRNAISKVKREDRDHALKEAEEKKRLEAERLRKEREERERLEAERLRKEREERERVEKERLEKERLAREQARKEREEQERIKRELWEKEKAENERIRKEKAEKARLEQERLAKERAEKARIERERLEKERQELEKQRKERLEKERIEKERIEKEKAEQKRLADAEAELERQESLRLKAEEQERKRIENEN